MGTTGRGVDIRGSSIRITYTLNGRQEKRTLRINGTPLPPTPANIAHAERIAAEIRDRIRLGRYHVGDFFPDDAPPVITRTLSEQLQLWLKTIRVEDSTADGYASAVRFWTHAHFEDESDRLLGDMPLDEIKHSMLKYVMSNSYKTPSAKALKAGDPLEPLSGKTLKNYLAPLKEALNLAVRDKVLSESPAKEIFPPKWEKEVPDPLTREELEGLLSYAKKQYPEEVYTLMEFWGWTGLRTSEVFGLRWPSVNLSGNSVQIKEALVRGKHKQKTKTGVVRDVMLNSRAFVALQRQRQYTQQVGLHVFLDPRYGTPWTEERAFRRSFWTPALAALGIRYRRPYNLRHTYATQLLMQGVNPAFAAKQLGHSVDLFLKTYSKWIDSEGNAREMAKLEASLSPPSFLSKGAGSA